MYKYESFLIKCNAERETLFKKNFITVNKILLQKKYYIIPAFHIAMFEKETLNKVSHISSLIF